MSGTAARLREWDAAAREFGFVFAGVTGGGHRRYRHCRSGRVVFGSGSPSEVRGLRNFRRDLRRVVRESGNCR